MKHTISPFREYTNSNENESVIKFKEANDERHRKSH